MKKLLPFISALIFIVSCGENAHKKTLDSSYQMIEGLAQGTSYHITYSDELERNFQLSVDSIIKVIDLSMSTYLDSSTISLCNTSAKKCELDDHMLSVLWKSYEVCHLTNGEFDPTVKPLIDFWGFGASQVANNDAVDSSLVDSLLRFVGIKYVKLFDKKNNEIFDYMAGKILDDASNYQLIKDSSVQLDFNAIAQGYTVDVLCEMLEDNGVYNYLVEVGGEVRVKGKNENGHFWKVGIDKPEEKSNTRRSLQAVLSLEEKSIATSGNYRKFRVKNGIKYSHTISAKTGYPVTHQILSATVIADNCMTADAFATAFMVMGHKNAIAYLQEQTTEIQGYIIYSDDKGNLLTYASPDIEDNIDEKLD